MPQLHIPPEAEQEQGYVFDVDGNCYEHPLGESKWEHHQTILAWQPAVQFIKVEGEGIGVNTKKPFSFTEEELGGAREDAVKCLIVGLLPKLGQEPHNALNIGGPIGGDYPDDVDGAYFRRSNLVVVPMLGTQGDNPLRLFTITQRKHGLGISIDVEMEDVFFLSEFRDNCLTRQGRLESWARKIKLATYKNTPTQVSPPALFSGALTFNMASAPPKRPLQDSVDKRKVSSERSVKNDVESHEERSVKNEGEDNEDDEEIDEEESEDGQETDERESEDEQEETDERESEDEQEETDDQDDEDEQETDDDIEMKEANPQSPTNLFKTNEGVEMAEVATKKQYSVKSDYHNFPLLNRFLQYDSSFDVVDDIEGVYKEMSKKWRTRKQHFSRTTLRKFRKGVLERGFDARGPEVHFLIELFEYRVSQECTLRRVSYGDAIALVWKEYVERYPDGAVVSFDR